MRCVRIHSPLVYCSPIRQEALCSAAKGRVITRRLVRRLGDTIAAPGFSLIGLRLTTSAPASLRARSLKNDRAREENLQIPVRNRGYGLDRAFCRITREDDSFARWDPLRCSHEDRTSTKVHSRDEIAENEIEITHPIF